MTENTSAESLYSP